MPAPQITPPPQTVPSNTGGCLLRVVWMLLGNAVLIITAIKITQEHQQLLSIADAVFWVVVAGVALARYLDVHRFHGQTASGQPTTPAGFQRYLVLLGAFALLVWFVAHAVAYWRR